jgi:hypothetical protein
LSIKKEQKKKDRQNKGQKKKDQTIQRTKEEGSDNTMDNRRRTSQYNG